MRHFTTSVTGLPLSTMWTINIFNALSPAILTRRVRHVTSIDRDPRSPNCSPNRWILAPQVHVIKLTEMREITPYKWVHPDDDDRR